MGLGVKGARFLRWLKRQKEVDYADALQLGRQELMLSKKDAMKWRMPLK